MTMEILSQDKERAQELRSGAQFACSILNNVIFPICKELEFGFDVQDREKLKQYVYNIGRLHSDYLDRTMSGQEGNPALSLVLKKQAEELWEQAEQHSPVKNPYIIGDIPEEVFDMLIINGSDIYDAEARPSQSAIERACIVYADDADLAKKAELKEACNALNKCFNGRAELFSRYIGIFKGEFTRIEGIQSYKPLIHGAKKK